MYRKAGQVSRYVFSLACSTLFGPRAFTNRVSAEQRPICRHCERLGFVCAYDYRLTWQSVYVHDQQPPATPARRRPPARNGWHRIFQWMFLNTGYDDFHALPTSKHAGGASSTYSDATSEIETLTTISTPAVSSPLSLTRASTPLTPWDGSEPGQSLSFFPPSRSLSPLPLANHHTYLWEYFDKCITPQCVINTLINPYRDILLRVAASSPDGPLLHCILAVSANELHNLGNSTFKTTIWDHRARALNLLRREVEVDSLGASWGLTSRTSQAQVLLSTLMLCFFEVRLPCLSYLAKLGSHGWNRSRKIAPKAGHFTPTSCAPTWSTTT